MGILDNLINKATKWESVEVSVEELVEMIEEKIIRADPTYEKPLTKAMKKKMVWGRSYYLQYNFCNKTMKVCLDFSIITRRLKGVFVLNVEERKEYTHPKGRENARRVQEIILGKIAATKAAC